MINAQNDFNDFFKLYLLQPILKWISLDIFLLLDDLTSGEEGNMGALTWSLWQVSTMVPIWTWILVLKSQTTMHSNLASVNKRHKYQMWTERNQRWKRDQPYSP